MELIMPHKTFGDDETARADELQHEADLKTQKVPFAVARGAVIEVQRGGKLVKLTAGEEITLGDVADPGGAPAHVIMQGLVDRRLVLAQTDQGIRAANCPADAEFRVGPDALLLDARIAVPGEQLIESDVTGGRSQLLELAQNGRVVHRPPTPARSRLAATGSR